MLIYLSITDNFKWNTISNSHKEECNKLKCISEIYKIAETRVNSSKFHKECNHRTCNKLYQPDINSQIASISKLPLAFLNLWIRLKLTNYLTKLCKPCN